MTHQPYATQASKQPNLSNPLNPTSPPNPTITPEAILNIFYPYVAINSESGTAAENAASAFVHRHFKDHPYYLQNPDHFGLHTLEQDPYQRQVAWALVKGQGSKTAVLIHHFDVVEIEDFKRHKAYAFSPDTLEKSLGEDPDALSEEALDDLNSGRWIFGRGTADMKGGGAVQMALIEAFAHLAHTRDPNSSQSPNEARDPNSSQSPNNARDPNAPNSSSFQGNLLLLAVPDEENLSAGMRAAAPLLQTLRLTHALEYVLMINSEPHQRKDPTRGMLSGGSIGKILPFVYVRGILAHAGKSAEGFNPVQILSEIVGRTEMNPDLGDTKPEVGEMSPPPTWLMARDSKVTYDVSMPLTAFGCLSVQPLSSPPDRITNDLLNTAREAAAEVAQRVNRAADLFHATTHRPPRKVTWRPGVMTFSDLLQQCQTRYGEPFRHHYQAALKRANQDLAEGKASNASATWTLLDAIFDFTGSDQPMVITGLIPPYYPSVSYLDRPEYTQQIQQLSASLNELTLDRFGQRYDLEAYFTGISDLSYAALNTEDISRLEAAVATQMPLYGDFYAIPFREIAENAMPCINIGPWGKDFHKISERILREDLLIRTPAMILKALELVLKEQ
jgi:arginine utilization protein RocB